MKSKTLQLLAVFLFLLSASVLLAGCQVIADAIRDLAGGGPQDTAPDGWEKHEGNGFSLYLPETWSGASTEEFDFFIEELKQMEPEFARMASEIEPLKGQIEFWALDLTSVAQDKVAVNCNIVKELNFLPLEDCMTEIYKQMEQFFAALEMPFELVNQRIVTLGSHEKVGRTVYNTSMAGMNMTSVQYIIKENNTLWYLSFVSGVEEFSIYEKTFDQIVETFKFH